MTALDFSSDLGKRAQKELEESPVVWLTTIAGSGTPQPNLVWFWWDGEKITVYTQPNALRLQNIDRNPRVSLNFNSDATGEIMTVITGSAFMLKDAPKAIENAAFIEKYAKGISRLGMTDQSFSDAYSVIIEITPDKLRGF